MKVTAFIRFRKFEKINTINIATTNLEEFDSMNRVNINFALIKVINCSMIAECN